MKRRGNRRYYQHHEVLDDPAASANLLYDQGFTISGARKQVSGAECKAERDKRKKAKVLLETASKSSKTGRLPELSTISLTESELAAEALAGIRSQTTADGASRTHSEIRELLSAGY